MVVTPAGKAHSHLKLGSLRSLSRTSAACPNRARSACPLCGAVKRRSDMTPACLRKPLKLLEVTVSKVCQSV